MTAADSDHEELVVTSSGRRMWRVARAEKRRRSPYLLLFRPRHPAQVAVTTFAAAIAVSTALLMLPVAHEPGKDTTFLQALFTATSSVCVTGLTVVDTPTHWSTFGEVVILAGIQIGGFGIMTLASLFGLLVARRLGLRTRLAAAAETRTLGLGDVGRVVRGVVAMSLVIETATAVVLAIRFATAYGDSPGRAAYRGIFHAVSSFNNAGFALQSDNLIGFVSDPFVCIPIAVAVVAGGLGFPVVFELVRHTRRPTKWSVHTQLVLFTSALLLVLGWLLVTAFEWANPRTLGLLDVPGKLLAGFFHAVQPRTAGFNAIDYGAAEETTLLVTNGLMFIGGAPGSTAGGIKVTTFMLLGFAIWSEARGNPEVEVFRWRVPPPALRQALSVALLGVAVCGFGTLALLALTGLDLDRVMFESVSAFATVGLSTGITPSLPPAAQYVLIGMMFLGRIGTITLASALALRERQRLYRLPEGRPIVG